MVNTLMSNLTRNMNRMSEYQDQLATGKRVIRASDDPVGTSKILKFKSDIAALNQYEKNTGDSLAWLEVTEATISDTGDVLQRMRELAVQAANGTNTAEDTQKIALEIEQMKKHLISNGNFSYAGRYAFSGYQTDKKLLNDDGSYNINVTSMDLNSSIELEYQVSIAQEMAVTTNGLDVFGAVELDNALTQSFPDEFKEGADATKAVLKGAIGTSGNLSGLAPTDTMTIAVDGTSYTLSGTELSVLSPPTAGEQVVEVLKGATDGGVPAVLLGSVANVFLDASGQLTIKSRQQGAMAPASSLDITYTSTIPANITAMETVFGIPDGASDAGLDAENAVVTGAVLLAGDYPGVPDVFANQKILVTYNGVDAEINLGSPSPANLTDLQTLINGQLNAKFGTGNVVANIDGTNPITFTGLPQDPKGQGSTLEVRTIRATHSQLMVDIDAFVAGLQTADAASSNAFLSAIDGHLNQILSVRADIGARVNRMELVANRISDNIISYTTMLSDSQDADMGGVIMFLKNAENVYKAALSTGSKVIQPSLIDFLR